MEEGIHTYFEGAEIIDVENYSVDLTKHFSTVPEVAVPLLKSAKCCFEKIKKCCMMHQHLSMQLRHVCQKKHCK